ncbi:MAG: metallophosphoesterase family protein [Conexivisphaerales archaeon]
MKITDLVAEDAGNYSDFIAYIVRFRNSIKKGKANVHSKKYYVIGDIHGDVKTLSKIYRKIGEIGENETIIFLGDYGDRGEYQVETWKTVAMTKLVLGERAITLRGNHEALPDVTPYPHDIKYRLVEKFGETYGDKTYSELFLTFQELPVVMFGDKFIALHGGLPVKDFRIDRIVDNVVELLWNDPFESIGYEPSPRGIGYLFGKDITEKWLSITNSNFLIRGHEPCEGFMVNHDGLVYTVFSMTGKPYFNSKAAFGIIENGNVNFEFI